MRVIGLGTDIVEIHRIADMIDKHAEEFLDRIFSPYEVEYCSTKKNAAQHFAGRWAAKEAVMKAFGTGFVKGIHWNEIVVISRPTGQPEVRLSGETERFASEMGIAHILLSISHGKEYATATAITCAAELNQGNHS